MASTYLLLKLTHVTAVLVTYVLFVLRGVWMMQDSPRLAARWVRIVPHVNDTLLLASAVNGSIPKTSILVPSNTNLSFEPHFDLNNSNYLLNTGLLVISSTTPAILTRSTTKDFWLEAQLGLY